MALASRLHPSGEIDSRQGATGLNEGSPSDGAIVTVKQMCELEGDNEDICKNITHPHRQLHCRRAEGDIFRSCNESDGSTRRRRQYSIWPWEMK